MDSNTTSSHFEGEGRSARFLRLQDAILPPYASLYAILNPFISLV